MLELIRAGGWPMIPLLLMSAVALGIIVERFWSLRPTRVLPPGLGDEVRAWVARGKPLEPAHIDSLPSEQTLRPTAIASIGIAHAPGVVRHQGGSLIT